MTGQTVFNKSDAKVDMKTLVIAEHNNVSLNPSTLNTISAGAQLGSVDVLVIGSECKVVCEFVARVSNVTTVLCADAKHYEHRLAEDVAPLVKTLATEYDYIIAPATSFGKNIAPRIAALLDVAQVSDLTQIESADTFIRPIYAGNALAKIKCFDAKKVLTIRTVSFDAAEITDNSAEIKTVDALSDSGLSSFISEKMSQSERPDLATAKVVVSGGRGVGSEENFSIIEALADKLGGAVGASRAAVDAGYIGNDKQVGQTGVVVAPELYIAIAISGAAQHIAGMKDSKVIVAINKDPDATIFKHADYGLVADLFEVVPELTAKI